MEYNSDWPQHAYNVHFSEVWKPLRSKLRGYDERSFVRASVSRLARLRPVYAARGVSMTELSASIWKGKDPSPDEAVDKLEPVDKPKIRRFGGAGSESLSAAVSESACLRLSRLNDW